MAEAGPSKPLRKNVGIPGGQAFLLRRGNFSSFFLGLFFIFFEFRGLNSFLVLQPKLRGKGNLNISVFIFIRLAFEQHLRLPFDSPDWIITPVSGNQNHGICSLHHHGMQQALPFTTEPHRYFLVTEHMKNKTLPNKDPAVFQGKRNGIRVDSSLVCSLPAMAAHCIVGRLVQQTDMAFV